MSGHSKWHNIQARKGKQDAVRSNLFSKLSKMIMIAARQGGADMDINFSLRLAVEKARKASMPKDKIDRAIKSGAGELKDGTQIEEAIYEGYGPGGVGVLVSVLTDNKNRTVSEIKHIFSKNGGSMGEAGSVKYLFEQKGAVQVESEKLKVENKDRDEIELELIDVGVEDIREEDGMVNIYTSPQDLQKVLEKLKELDVEIEDSGLEWVAKDLIPIPEDKSKQLENLFEAFEENDDVEDYFTNAE